MKLKINSWYVIFYMLAYGIEDDKYILENLPENKCKFIINLFFSILSFPFIFTGFMYNFICRLKIFKHMDMLRLQGSYFLTVFSFIIFSIIDFYIFHCKFTNIMFNEISICSSVLLSLFIFIPLSALVFFIIILMVISIVIFIIEYGDRIIQFISKLIDSAIEKTKFKDETITPKKKSLIKKLRNEYCKNIEWEN